MNSDYFVRRIRDEYDVSQLKQLFSQAFEGEKVDELAMVMHHHLPDFSSQNWLIAEHIPTGALAAACALLPWQWQFGGADGITLKVAEQGIVATSPEHRNLGLQKMLNDEFDRELQRGEYDLAVIQGIPGFYHRFGYRYSLPIENHINLDWQQIPDTDTTSLCFRQATSEDIPFLMTQDRLYQQGFDCATLRSTEQWRYLLTHSKQTEYGSEVWIAEQHGEAQFYCRLADGGFGDGQHLNECSQQLSSEQMLVLLSHAKVRGQQRNKPFLRLNLHNDSPLGRFAQELGAQPGEPYGWQLKLPDGARWLMRIKPVLEQRLAQSPSASYSGRLRLDSFGQQLILHWQQGELVTVSTESEEAECQETACIPQDLLPVLLTGGHDWRSLRQYRPDIFAQSEHCGQLLDALFPQIRSWHYTPY